MPANPWFDYNANTPEVMRVKAAERDLLNEGYNPKDRNFWAELSRRASGTNEGRSVSTTPRKGGPKVGGQPTAGNGRRTEYHLSEERVNAIKEAGAWDDPAARNRMIKAYREYDKQNPAR